MKSENIKNSIIVSCRNSASWLPAQIEALVSQIRTDDSEILIIDNGSRDRTLSVAKRLRHSVPNLKVISADSRKGFAHARNVGAQNASGRFLLFCDGKDIVERDWIEKMSKALEKNPIVSGRLLTSEINPSWAIEAPPPEMRLEHSAVFKTFDHLPWASASNFGIHRKIFLKTGGFDERLTALEEVD